MPDVFAPYNFVPFSNKVCIRYKSEQELPPHNVIDPELLTGEIYVTMMAETPVVISDGDGNFFRGANGKYMIPSSSVRGMLRENMQILGFGLIRPGEDLDDYHVYFREMASAGYSTANELKKYYQDVLGIVTERSDAGKSFSVPRNVKAGYVRNVSGKYHIQPIKGSAYRISRKMADVQQFGEEYARTIRVAYYATGSRVSRICAEAKAERGMEHGTLLYTGKWVGRNPNHLYLFPKADETADTLEISDEDILSYRTDYEKRVNSLKAYYDVNFWALPKDGEEKEVFYLEHSGHIYFGRSPFLRVGHEYSIAEGLPERHKDIAAKGDVCLDYPHAIMGFATPVSSYRSRVSVGDFPAVGAVQPGEKLKLILGEPKPGYYPGYVREAKNYSDDKFLLRGYKQYWLKEAKAVRPEKENVASTLQPMPAGTKFTGSICFRNLHKDELGLLLWALRLEDGCFQSIGMGKPYGFGRMKLNVDSLKLFPAEKLYDADGLCTGGEPVDDSGVEQMIRAFDAEISKLLYIKTPKNSPSIKSVDEIKDLFCIHRIVRNSSEVRYMELPEYKNTRSALPTIADERERNPLPAASDGEKSEEKQEAVDLSKMTSMQRAMYEAEHKGSGKR